MRRGRRVDVGRRGWRKDKHKGGSEPNWAGRKERGNEKGRGWRRLVREVSEGGKEREEERGIWSRGKRVG